jgi:hypothetical protein
MILVDNFHVFLIIRKFPLEDRLIVPGAEKKRPTMRKTKGLNIALVTHTKVSDQLFRFQTKEINMLVKTSGYLNGLVWGCKHGLYGRLVGLSEVEN